MQDKITSKDFRLPSVEEIVFQELAAIIEANNALSEVFSQNFVPNANQRRIEEVIANCQLPEGETLHILLYGGVGSGKTWGALSHVLDKSLKHPDLSVLCVRQTSSDIKKSIYTETVKFLDRYGVAFRKNDADTNIVLPNNSNLWMKSDKALVKPGRAKSDSLGSMAFSFVILEEVDSISEELVDTIPGRMRQRIQGFRKVIFYICNPPSQNHWLYKKFFIDHDRNDPRSSHRVVNCPMEGNLQHLDPGYVATVEEAYARNPSQYKRFRKGEFAPDHKGDPIYADVFDRDVHCYKPSENSGKKLFEAWNPNYPILRSWDIGFNGNCLTVFQDDMDRRQIRWFKVVLEKKCLFNIFCSEWVHWCNRIFTGAQFMDYCDPAARQKTTLAEKNAFDIIWACTGSQPRYLISTVQYGVEIVGELLTLMGRKEGLAGEPIVKPTMLFDEEECEVAVDALESGYCNKKGTPRGAIDPFKDGTYDHVADAIRYGIINVRRPRDPRNRVLAMNAESRPGWTPEANQPPGFGPAYNGGPKVIRGGARIRSSQAGLGRSIL